MSDQSANQVNLFNAELPESVNNAVKNLTDLPSKSVGQTISDCWFLVFGGISHLAEKRRIKYAKALEEFQQSLSSKSASIPEENRVEPNTQLVMSALENVKYCVEEKELREMFANLISASLDNRLQSRIHPSFCEILKSMTPLDAQNLKILYENRFLPVVDILNIHDNESNHHVVQFLLLLNPEYTTYKQQSLSINYLVQKGLIEVLHQKFDDFDEDDKFSDTIAKIQRIYPKEEFVLQKRVVRLTPLGHSFLEICCPE